MTAIDMETDFCSQLISIIRHSLELKSIFFNNNRRTKTIHINLNSEIKKCKYI